jgi:hypothetical protein
MEQQKYLKRQLEAHAQIHNNPNNNNNGENQNAANPLAGV